MVYMDGDNNLEGASIEDFNFHGPNLTAAQTAYGAVRTDGDLRSEPLVVPPPKPPEHATSILDPNTGMPPKTKTGAWATQRPQRREWIPPCNHGCPAGNDVRGFLAAAGERDFDRALEIIHETSPFPSVCGRVCPAPCMDACHRHALDEPVNIREMERYIGDHGKARVKREDERPEVVAVVGSGPAGLSAAYHLGRLGYSVTVYEAEAEPGGVMRTGIPPYRLPRDVLDREIDFILQHGVRIEANHRVDRKRLLELSHEYAAVFVATGLQEARTLSLGTDDPKVISQGIVFLSDSLEGKADVEGQRVVVIGGGNTAMDVSRTALRLGAKEVRILYRRTRNEMPAIKEEIEEALEEGVELRELVSPVRIKKLLNGVSITCQRMRLGEPDESGRRRPIPDTGPGAEFNVDCDRVILAVGELGDLSILPEGAEIHDHEVRLGLSGAPIFAGGDLATGEGTVTAAIGSGRKAAYHIHLTLTGEDLFPHVEQEVIPGEQMKLDRFEKAPQHHGRELPVPERLRRSFDEVHRGFVETPDHAEAVEEALRCMSCGYCNNCDLCLENCPEGVLIRVKDFYAFNYDNCKGCGLCAAECPRGVVYMEQI